MGTVNTQLTPEIVRPESSDDFSCDLKWEINQDDNGGVSTYNLGSSYFARLYKGRDILSVIAFSTNGTVSYSGTSSSSKTEQISFSGGKTSSISFPYSRSFSYKVIGKVYNASGGVISPTFTPPDNKETTVVSSVECFCILEVTYVTTYSKYAFSSRFGGESLLVATSVCGGETNKATISVIFEEEYSSSSSQRSRSSVSTSTSVSSGVSGTSTSTFTSTSWASWYSSSSKSSTSSVSISSSESTVQTTSVTLVYKDFVTGEVIEGVSVTVDGSGKGTTNATGQITIHGITTNEVHTIKASKEGYLTTDSDSLANDSFIINS